MFEKLMGEAGVQEYDQAEVDFLSNPGMYARDADNEEKKEESSGEEDMRGCRFDDDDNYAMEMEDVDRSLHEPLYTLGPEGPGGATKVLLLES